jgi:predicted secreted Zn-dependent protease
MLALLTFATAACDPDRDAARSPATDLQQPGLAASVVAVTLHSTVREVFYIVEGTTHPAIVRSIDRNDIAGPDEQDASGLTTSELDWSVEIASSGGTCAISLVAIDLELAVIVPQHASAGDLPAEVRDRWLVFAAGVRLHEQRHVEIELAQADALRTALERLPANCDAFERAAGETAAANRETTTALHEDFHARETIRRASARGPLERAVERNEVRLAATQIDLNDLAARIETIEDRYPDRVVPEPAYSEYLQLQQKYNGRVAAHNAILAELRSQTDELVWLY